MARPFVIAVTGGAGAGKSTVARLFADHGAVVLDADDYARRALQSREVVAALVAAFGPGVLDASGSVDRRALADAAFTDAASVARLDAATHPPIVAAMLVDLDALFAGEEPPSFVVLDVPLLSAVPEVLAQCEVIVAVEAPRALREARLATRGLTPQDARRRIDLQPDDVERRTLASDILPNEGSLAELESSVDTLWAQLAQRATR